jgi:hypothetical protein
MMPPPLFQWFVQASTPEFQVPGSKVLPSPNCRQGSLWISEMVDRLRSLGYVR